MQLFELFLPLENVAVVVFPPNLDGNLKLREDLIPFLWQNRVQSFRILCFLGSKNGGPSDGFN